MIEQLSQASLDEALEKDLGRIVAKAQAGERLTLKEREIVQAARADLAGEPPESVGFLEGGGVVLNGTQAAVAGAYGYSVRAIKEWIRLGRDQGVPCPFRRPAEMPGWYERVFHPRRCPAKLRAAVDGLLSGKMDQRQPEESAPSAWRAEVAESEMGIAAMLQRARRHEALVYQLFLKAVEANDETRSAFLQKQWGDAAEKLRAIEKMAPKSLEELGVYVRKDDVKRELAGIHSAILKVFEAEMKGARSALMKTATQAEWDRGVAAVVESAKMVLVGSSFAEPLELAAE